MSTELTNTEFERINEQIIRHVKMLKRELDRFSARLVAVERCRRAIFAHIPENTSLDAADFLDEVAANIDAIEGELVSFKGRLHDRILHIEQARSFLARHATESESELRLAFCQHIMSDTELCLADAAATRQSYDELIANLNAVIHLNDQ